MPRNGDEAAKLVDEVLGAPEVTSGPGEAGGVEERVFQPTQPTPEMLGARRDWMLARVALMLIDAAKLLDPITRIVTARILALIAFTAAAGVVLYTLQLDVTWPRVATCGLFLALCAWAIRKGQG